VLPNSVFFLGQDGLNDSGLWETNGTGSGTFELAPTGASASGSRPAYNGQYKGSQQLTSLSSVLSRDAAWNSYFRNSDAECEQARPARIEQDRHVYWR
jgi:ELWxxDGT repeat protein